MRNGAGADAGARGMRTVAEPATKIDTMIAGPNPILRATDEAVTAPTMSPMFPIPRISPRGPASSPSSRTAYTKNSEKTTWPKKLVSDIVSAIARRYGFANT